MRHRANQKTWADEKGNLVPDGHADARVLVTREGQEMSEDELKRFPNASEFFPSLQPSIHSDEQSPGDREKVSSVEIQYEDEEEQKQVVPPVPVKKKKAHRRK